MAHEVSAGPLPALGRSNARARAVPFLGSILLSATVTVWVLWFACRGPLTFDDAYMFHRYGTHVLSGLGVVWNEGGAPTYGLTSQLWLFLLLPLFMLPLSAASALQLASWLTGGLAVAVMGRTVAREAQSPLLSASAAAIGAVGLPLLLHPAFAAQLTTGMDTMLSLLLNAAVMLVAMRYAKVPSTGAAIVSGLVSLAAILTRPENGICALGVPLLAFAAQAPAKRWRDLVYIVVLPLLLLVASLALAQFYYGSALPLSFYAKSAHGYDGFLNPESAIRYLAVALSCAIPFIAALITGMRHGIRPPMLVLAMPAGLTVCYLLTVRQIMGWDGRFFIPFLPYLVIPGLLSLDAMLARGLNWSDLGRPLARGIAGGFAVLLGVLVLQSGIGRLNVAALTSQAVAAPRLDYRAATPLPVKSWFAVVQQIGDHIVSRLPAGAVVAASEIGYIGSVAPHVAIVDLVGLNDTQIGRSGLSMDYLLGFKPDVIWFPHGDYTGLRSKMLSDPRLYEHYVVIAGAFNYGLAIRRDSPHRASIERDVAAAWAQLYPDRAMPDYVVTRTGEVQVGRGSS
ncbi:MULTISPECIES: hypothetical protein [unclassified Bradyrhizobium]|uniref:hypothetical protein n=1 Tax=unclassified Bradyrhizobium TaxID=2631580 RepID=UPI00247A50F7|nr:MULTISPECIES: hypothetical protein [unclassified Bradyrhizobium]WGR68546.1 hypothetical protein MTX24_24290 [Bradyrhizobium sp. ISRA426]WGR80601.1 hypothetical protein MTX21_09405 [Bradyrhizobium sp. ISRA430]WGR83786.1 hypothetical protein MTX25_23970 [Bradyrhizobium sp. ISRA432]